MAKEIFPPASLEAKSKDQLRLLMLQNNSKHGKKFHYFDFSYAQGKWHCWYEISETELRQDEINGQES